MPTSDSFEALLHDTHELENFLHSRSAASSLVKMSRVTPSSWASRFQQR
jgi:hypothetical protein